MSKVFFTKFSKKEKILSIIAGVIIFTAVFGRVVVTPINNEIQRFNRDIQLKEYELFRYFSDLQQKETIAERYQQYVTKYVEKSGSDEEEVAILLREIEKIASESSVHLVNIKPRPPSPKSAFYEEYTVEVKVEGGMDAVVAFLCNLNMSQQLLRTEKVYLSLKTTEISSVEAEIVVTKVLII